MISKKMIKALNEQAKKEMYSANLYLSMSSYFENKGLHGFAQWMRIQYQEEMEHGFKFFDYVQSRGERATVLALDEPTQNWSSIEAVFEQALEHEKYVTACIADLTEQARKDKDHATEIFLQWFVTEQVEEEQQVQDILDALKFVKGDPIGVYMLNQQLGKRKPD